jgi:hypothetical protein
MLNAISTRAVLGLLVLAAPLLAIIPPGIDLQLAGAQQLSSFEYTVKGGDKIGLSVVAKEHALIWAFALQLDESGEWTGVLVPLIYEEDAASGQASVEMQVPEGVAGMFEVKAVAISGSDVLESATFRVLVQQAGEPKLKVE